MATTTITKKKKPAGKKKPVVRLSSNKDYPIAKQFRDQVEAGRMSPDEAIRRLKGGGMKIDFLRRMFYKYDSDLLGMKMPSKRKPPDKKIRNPKARKPIGLANKGGMMKKKTKYMAKGGMKKTKYMAKGGMKKTKYMARGGVARRRK
jgi:hypothetical protein